MKNYVQPGDTVEVTIPAGGVASGAGVLVGTLFGVAAATYAAGVAGQVKTTGVFDLAKNTGGGSAWTVGAKIYWDNTAKLATITATANTFIGHALAAAADGAAVGRVRLHGAPT